MNAPIRRLSFIVAALFASLLIATTWIQFVQAKDLQDRPNNRRTLLASYARERGAILVGGSPVARSVPSKDQLKWLRTYPSARLYSQVTGYYSFTTAPAAASRAPRTRCCPGSPTSSSTGASSTWSPARCPAARAWS